MRLANFFLRRQLIWELCFTISFPHKTQIFCSLLKNIFLETDEMTQWVMVIASKSKEVSSISGPHGGKNHLWQIVF